MSEPTACVSAPIVASCPTVWSSRRHDPSTPSSWSALQTRGVPDARRRGALQGARTTAKHLELFPEGQFVGLDGDRVVAATATIRLHFDFDHVTHTFADDHPGRLADLARTGRRLAVRRGHRRRIRTIAAAGLAQALYAARQELVWALGLKGQVTAGMMSGYGAVKHG